MRKTFYIFFLFLFSCTSIQQAVIQDKQVTIRVEQYGNAGTDPSLFYTCEVKRNGGEREFHVIANNSVVIYLLPSNKLTLLYAMEMGLKDIKSDGPSYYHIKITAHQSKRSYKVNTDLIANFITGLKKK